MNLCRLYAVVHTVIIIIFFKCCVSSLCGFLPAVGQSSASSQHLPNGCGSSATMQASAAATLAQGRPHPITVSFP